MPCKTYAAYNPDWVYTDLVPPNPPEQIGRDIKCLQLTRSTRAGVMLEVRAWPSYLCRQDYIRARRTKPTTDQQAMLNARESARKLVRIINANFGTGDYWCTFGWDFDRMPDTLRDARREIRNYLRRVAYHAKKAGAPVPIYVYVIEWTAGNPAKGQPATKYHVHLVMSGTVDRDLVEDLWNGGEYPRVRRIRVKDIGGLTGLGTYITKQYTGADRTKYQRAWGASVGLKDHSAKPTESYSKLSARQVERMARDRDTIKETMERKYPGYIYDEDHPAEIRYNDRIGGYYLFARLYRRPPGNERRHTKWDKNNRPAPPRR